MGSEEGPSRALTPPPRSKSRSAQRSQSRSAARSSKQGSGSARSTTPTRGIAQAIVDPKIARRQKQRAGRTAGLREARAGIKATARPRGTSPVITKAPPPKRSGTPPAARVSFADQKDDRMPSPLPKLDWDTSAGGSVSALPSRSPSRQGSPGRKGKGKKGKGAKDKSKGKGKSDKGKDKSKAGKSQPGWRTISFNARKDGGANPGGG